MTETCPKCGEKTNSTKPAKFSPEDKWGKYRRMAKKEN
jgi:H/ACA ribonucleoprotein complex subunit 3